MVYLHFRIIQNFDLELIMLICSCENLLFNFTIELGIVFSMLNFTRSHQEVKLWLIGDWGIDEWSM